MWRVQLHGHPSPSELLGDVDLAFSIYNACLSAFFLMRFVSLRALAVLDRGSLPLDWNIRIGIASALAVPAVITAHSSFCYLGWKRLIGIDHFKQEVYASMGLETRGVFKYIDNPIYKTLFPALYISGLIEGSRASLLVATFYLMLIWVLYFCLEKPDIETIFGGRSSVSEKQD